MLGNALIRGGLSAAGGGDFRTGAIRWERELHSGVPPMARHIRNSYASETPVTDGERLYVYFGTIGLVAALDMVGNVVWTAEIEAHNEYTLISIN